MIGRHASPSSKGVPNLKWGRLKVLFFVVLDFYLAFYETESRVVDLGLKDSSFAKIFPSFFYIFLFRFHFGTAFPRSRGCVCVSICFFLFLFEGGEKIRSLGQFGVWSLYGSLVILGFVGLGS